MFLLLYINFFPFLKLKIQISQIFIHLYLFATFVFYSFYALNSHFSFPSRREAFSSNLRMFYVLCVYIVRDKNAVYCWIL